MKLPFGKKAQCGNFYVLKRARTLSKKEIKKLRDEDGIPSDVRKTLERGSLPYITVSTVSESWKIEFVIGMEIYNFIDEIPVATDAEGNLCYYGDGYNALYFMLCDMMFDTAVPVASEYRQAKRAMSQLALDITSRVKGRIPISEADRETFIAKAYEALGWLQKLLLRAEKEAVPETEEEREIVEADAGAVLEASQKSEALEQMGKELKEATEKRE